MQADYKYMPCSFEVRYPAREYLEVGACHEEELWLLGWGW
jgi:hypothetical protein